MTSAKCFINWMKEAGRGHLTAFLGWGVMLVYGILTITRLSFDTDYTYFGIGNIQTAPLGAGLGLVTAFLEFFYLFQQKKQDFYYSLPVKKSIVFWSRYVHGAVHVLLPIALTMGACGIWQAAIDAEFAPFAVSYTGKSFLAIAGTFLIFYHIGMLCASVCGNPVSAAALCGVVSCYFQILFGSAFVTFASEFFYTYYRMPLLEKLVQVLAPLRLAEELTGRAVYEKPLVLRYSPSGGEIAAALIWIAVLFLLSAAAAKRRKTERTGRIFVLTGAERAAECALSFLAGVWAAGFVVSLTGMASESRLAAGALACLIGAGAAGAAHTLLEYVMKDQETRLLRRKYQLAAACAVSAAAGLAFSAGASSYDTYFPEEVSAVGISIDGLGMEYGVYTQAAGKEENYETDDQLAEYTLDEDGKPAAMGWLKDIAGRGVAADQEAPEGVYTWAAVCYHLEDGAEHYRAYPLDREDVDSFAAVYETAEYKQTAYPGVSLTEVGEDRFTWDDGVTGAAMKLTAEEKEHLIQAYREDVQDMEMAELTTALPAGFVEVKSAAGGRTTDLAVYPFFEKTCAILRENGVDTGKTIRDYQIESVEVREVLFPSRRGMSGGVSMSFYEEPEEVAEWREKLVPDRLDIQPILYPLDHSKETKAVIEDTETNSLIQVDCAVMPGK